MVNAIILWMKTTQTTALSQTWNFLRISSWCLRKTRRRLLSIWIRFLETSRVVKHVHNICFSQTAGGGSVVLKPGESCPDEGVAVNSHRRYQTRTLTPSASPSDAGGPIDKARILAVDDDFFVYWNSTYELDVTASGDSWGIKVNATSDDADPGNASSPPSSSSP